MKEVAFVSGTIAGSLSVLGILFKTMHWPGAGIMYVIGFSLLALVFIPSFAKYKYSKSK